MDLAQMNAETGMEGRHSTQRTAHLMISIHALTDCWNGVYDLTDFLTQLRRTATRLNTLADAIQNPEKTTATQPERKAYP